MKSRPIQLSRVCATSTDTPNYAFIPSLAVPDFNGNDDPAYDTLNDEEDDDALVRWYPLHIRHSSAKRAFNVRNELVAKGFPTYLRLEDKEIHKDGERLYLTRPVITNLIFVKARKKILRLLKHENTVCQPLQFMAKARRTPSQKTEIIHISDEDMSNFIDTETRPDPFRQRIPLTYRDFLDKPGHRVRIIRGAFLGIEGEVKRIMGHRIVVVQLRDVKTALGITHICPADLEFID